jgi:exonuclease-1
MSTYAKRFSLKMLRNLVTGSRFVSPLCVSPSGSECPMGVAGLLQLLTPGSKEVDVLVECRGLTLGIDGNVWLHAFACVNAQELVNGKRYDNIALSFHRRLRQLVDNDITPLVVLDSGTSCPGKLVDAGRKAKRAQALLDIATHTAARTKPPVAMWREAITITGELKRYLIDKVLKPLGVEYIVAPYEADPQLAHLYKTGRITAVWSIDSDFLVYGCKALIQRSASTKRAAQKWPIADLFDMAAAPSDQLNPALRSALTLHGHAALIPYAVVNGCDYAKFAKHAQASALKYLGEWGGEDCLEVSSVELYLKEPLKVSLKRMREEGGWWGARSIVCVGSRSLVQKVFNCFLHAVVYDHASGAMRPLSGASTDITHMPEVGALVTDLAAVAAHVTGASLPLYVEHVVEPAVVPKVSKGVWQPTGSGEKFALVLPDPDKKPSAMSVGECKSVLASRRWGLSGLQGELRARVQDLYNFEGRTDPHGGPQRQPGIYDHVHVTFKDENYDPKGYRDLAYGRQKHPSVHSELDWVRAVGSSAINIGAVSPQLDRSTIRAWHELTNQSARKDKEGSGKTLDIADLEHADFSYLPTRPDPVTPGAYFCAFRIKMLPSLKAECYGTTVAARVLLSEQEDEPEFITEVLEHSCGQNCKAGLGTCVHVSGLLHIVLNQERPAGCVAKEIPTAGQCRWRQPGAGDMYSVRQPASYLPLPKLGGVPKLEPREHVTRDVDGGRGNFDPVRGQLTDVDSPARVALRREMMAELRRVKNGRPSAWENTYGVFINRAAAEKQPKRYEESLAIADASNAAFEALLLEARNASEFGVPEV